MSVRATRFNPVLALETVTRASAITAPVGSVMVPKTVASWVCGHADAEKLANDRAKSMHGLCEARVGHARNPPMMTATYLYCSKSHEKGVPGIFRRCFRLLKT